VALEVSIASIKKRGFLRQIAEGAKLTASTMREALLSAQASVFNSNLRNGRILVSTSGNGQSGSFEIWSPGKEFTQDNIFALTEQLLEVLDTAVSSGFIDAADPAIIDSLFAVMCDDDRMRGVRQKMGDFSGLNFPATSLR